ncbi:MAG: VOC family protein [Bacteroidia bacterium]
MIQQNSSKSPGHITGIGGIFLRSSQVDRMNDWYSQSLGLDIGPYGVVFPWKQHDDPDQAGATCWNIMDKDDRYFLVEGQSYMVNYRVDHLALLLEKLKKQGIETLKPVETHEFGSFAWILDPDGNQIELWEPVDQALGL